MNYALSVPNFGDYGDPATVVELARDAETSGWDAFFLWDHIRFSADFAVPMVDPWVTLGAIAQATGTIRIGTMVTPLSRRRPHKLARETVTLDHLSGGRLTLGVGLGEPPDADFAMLGEQSDPKVRAAMLDEGLAVLAAAWAGEPFEHHGDHYTVEGPAFLPPALQQPRIPVWIAGAWPAKPAFRRAARWDGVFPIVVGGPMGFRGATPQELSDIAFYVGQHRQSDTPLELVASGSTLKDDDMAPIDAYKAVGATWWVESIGYPDIPFERWRELIRSGPPGIT